MIALDATDWRGILALSEKQEHLIGTHRAARSCSRVLLSHFAVPVTLDYGTRSAGADPNHVTPLIIHGAPSAGM